MPLRSFSLPLFAFLAALPFASLQARHHSQNVPDQRSSSTVVRYAPDFTIPGPGVRAQSLRGMRGQPVVLVIAESQKTKPFRKQLDNLRAIYQEFASRGVVFAVALKNNDGSPIRSNVPFAIANDGPKVAADYAVTGDFSVAVIGKDGNLDLQSSEPQTAQRIRDIVQNSYQVQSASRRNSPETVEEGRAHKKAAKSGNPPE